MSKSVNTPIIMFLIVAIIVVFIPATPVAATGNVFDYFNKGTTQEDVNEDIANEGITNGESATFVSSNTWLFITALLKLVAATTVIIFIIYFGAKIITVKRRSLQSGQNMQTIGVHAVGQNKTVQLVRIGKKVYVLGVGENINLIKELSLDDSAEIYQQIDSQSQDTGDADSSFTNQFDSIFKNKLTEFKKRNAPEHYRTENEREHL